MKLFYSWQSDTDCSTNKTFIEECLREVFSEVNLITDFSDRSEGIIELDKDTLNISGFPEMIPTILGKISEADGFVADLTFVAKIGDKGIPNPNVMFELGYAIYCLGYSRVIPVMNTYCGMPVELPFDIRQRRWPIQYNLTPDASNGDREQAKESLKKSLTETISYFRSIPEKDMISPLQPNASYLDIIHHILTSNLNDWSEQYEIEPGVFQVYYHKGPNLRVIIDQSEQGIENPDYKSTWANCFLHPAARSYKAKIFFSSTLIADLILVSVDEGNALIPQPTLDLSGKHYIIDPIPYKIAQLFDSRRILDDYIDKADQHLRKEGLSLRFFPSS